MIYEERSVTLRDGTVCTLRSPDPEDTEQMLNYLEKIMTETHFMMRLPSEVDWSYEQECALLMRACEDGNQMMIAAFVDGEIAGNVSFTCVSHYYKAHHRASIAIGICEKYWGRGIGSLLMGVCLDEAKKAGCVQAELGVYADNARAQALYQKFEFVPYGRVPRAFRLAPDDYRDEILMAREL